MTSLDRIDALRAAFASELDEATSTDALEHVRVRRVAHLELADLHDSKLFFTNVNTPEDFKQAGERMKDEG